MPKRPPRSSRAVPSRRPPEPTAALHRTLAGRKKAELVDALVELAEADRGILRQLVTRFDVATAPDELVAATRQAIVEATAFDPREINRNFDYDSAAYGEVKRNLGRLITSGQLRPAMPLALDLMTRGSHQVEMSDEGLMTEEIEDCVNEVIGVIAQCDLPSEEVKAWCSAMLAADRVGFIARESLEALLRRVQATKPQ
jgi:hypothetical protein